MTHKCILVVLMCQCLVIWYNPGRDDVRCGFVISPPPSFNSLVYFPHLVLKVGLSSLQMKISVRIVFLAVVENPRLMIK